MYISARLGFIPPESHTPNVTAGLMWQPEMFPMVYAIATTDNPNANATPIVPTPAPTVSAAPPANTALPHPISTRIIVPMSSATYFFIIFQF